MPRREQDTAVAAVVSDVLEGIHHVRDEAEAEGEAEGDAGPDTVWEERRLLACCAVQKADIEHGDGFRIACQWRTSSITS